MVNKDIQGHTTSLQYQSGYWVNHTHWRVFSPKPHSRFGLPNMPNQEFQRLLFARLLCHSSLYSHFLGHKLCGYFRLHDTFLTKKMSSGKNIFSNFKNYIRILAHVIYLTILKLKNTQSSGCEYYKLFMSAITQFMLLSLEFLLIRVTTGSFQIKWGILPKREEKK